MISTIITRLKLKPNDLFLVDSIGAFISAALLWAIFIYAEIYHGIPRNNYTILLLIAFAFSAHSAIHFFCKHKRPGVYLKIIGTANILYCCLTAGLMLVFARGITIIELIYLIGEIILICTLSVIELRLSKGN